MLRFDEAKATQAAAYFLHLRGGQMHYIKLVKLLYLTDREALLRWGAPVTTDRHVSMDNGPVTSRILNLITEDRAKPVWSEYVSAPLDDYEVRLLKEAPTDRLSPAEEKLMREIFERYGHRNRWDLIDNVMHKLPEWRDPQGSSIPIQIRDILEAVGEDEEQIRAVIRELHSINRAEDDLARVYA
ncbi:MAG: Panacea domain-containing protein [Terriglobales bacterium]